MPTIGLTDHANMFEAFKFVDAVFKHPIHESYKEDKLLK